MPPERVAGAVLITDGEVHDAPKKSQIKAPLHALIVGRKDERDRKLTVVDAARFAIVGQDAQMVLRVDDFGSNGGGPADVTIRVDGHDAGARTVPIGKNATIHVPIAHGGENVVELEARPGPAELTLQNNRAVVAVSGVRDRLRVLLISGEPHAGERVWRNLLKADPSVRSRSLHHSATAGQAGLYAHRRTLAHRISTRELFSEKLDSFDLIIFDRYRERGILPLAYFENIAAYVENGGALLLSAGRILRADEHLSHTALRRAPGGADRRDRRAGLQADGDATGRSASRHARSSRREYRWQAAELGPLVPSDRRQQDYWRDGYVGTERQATSRAGQHRQRPRRGIAFRSAWLWGARLRGRRPAGRAFAPPRALAYERA
ncbi:MAG: hypothetical protein WDM89_13240 [Rhizomicrobium sp.]